MASGIVVAILGVVLLLVAGGALVVFILGNTKWSNGTREDFVAACIRDADGTPTQCGCIATYLEKNGVREEEIRSAMLRNNTPTGTLRTKMTDAALSCR